MQSIQIFDVLVILLYVFVMVYLGWLGYIKTKTAADYLLAGRSTNPFIMALSYGATFISTSAIVGFGGVAAMFGMSLLWLTFLNIFVGIFIAFVFIGPVARRMGHRLDAHTFPELLGKRYDSKFIQVFAGLIIFVFMPLYAAAVMIGGCEFLTVHFNIQYEYALLIFALIVAIYVVMGGLKAVMYTDALQGVIMLVGMLFLLIFTYTKLGGVTESHQSLTSLTPMVPEGLKDIGHRGWTSMPAFGFGDKKYDLWWIVISSITMGVGIGVLAQPQLIVRFMTVKSDRELNKAVTLGGLFLLIMVGVPYIVGSLSNVYFTKHGTAFTGKVVKQIDAEKGYCVIQLMKQEGEQWVGVSDDKGQPKTVPVVLTGNKIGVTKNGEENIDVVEGRSISIVNAKGKMDQIIPVFIKTAMPKWFTIVFLLTLLSAAMSTLSSQFHVIGTSMGRDVYEVVTKSSFKSITITRTAIVIGVILAVLWAIFARNGNIIARATAIFFGMCAAAFLPAFIGGLFWKKMTKAGAITSIFIGFIVSAFWIIFVHAKEAGAIGLVQKFTDGKTSLFWAHPNWPEVDAVVVALPVSIIAAVLVSLMTKPPTEEHLNKCFTK